MAYGKNMTPKEELVSKEEKALAQLVRSELNLQKWICLFATRHYKGRSRELVRKTKNGEIRVIVGRQIDDRGREVQVGLLRVPAYKILQALIHIWEVHGKPDDWVVSSLYELATVMKQQWGGATGKTLRIYLKNLRDIPIQWIGFFSKKDGYIDILEDQPLRFIKIEFLTRKRKEEEIKCRFRFKFDERIQDNLLLGYTKPLRLDVISKLDDISTLVYCHVDLVMADRNVYVRKSKQLLKDLGLDAKRYRYPSWRKAALEKVIDELIVIPQKEGKAGTPLSTGILTEMFISRTKDKKDWNVHFKKEPFPKSLSPRLDWEIEGLIKEMEDVLGVGGKNRLFYTKIARRCPADLIRIALRDTLDEEREGKITGSRKQFFGYWIQVLALNRGIDLGLNSSFGFMGGQK